MYQRCLRKYCRANFCPPPPLRQRFVKFFGSETFATYSTLLQSLETTLSHHNGVKYQTFKFNPNPGGHLIECLSCLAVFCNHYHWEGPLDWGQNVWYLTPPCPIVIVSSCFERIQWHTHTSHTPICTNWTPLYAQTEHNVPCIQQEILD